MTKKILLVFTLALLLSNAFSQKAVVTVLKEKLVKDKYGQISNYPGEKTDLIELRPNGGFYIKVELPAVAGAEGSFDCATGFFKINDDGTEENIVEKDHSCFESKPVKWESLYPVTEPGKYVAKFYPRDNPSKPYGSCKFTVVSAKNGGPNNVSTKVEGTARMYMCSGYDKKSGKPTGVKKELKAGSCANFLIDLGKVRDDLQYFGWVVYKNGATVEENEYIDQKYQDEDEKHEMRYVYRDVPICLFKTPGNYTIYCIDWYKREDGYHNSELKDYLGKIEIQVK